MLAGHGSRRMEVCGVRVVNVEMSHNYEEARPRHPRMKKDEVYFEQEAVWKRL